MYMYKGGDYVYIYIYIHLAHNDTDFRQIFSSIYVYIYIYIHNYPQRSWGFAAVEWHDIWVPDQRTPIIMCI